MERRGGREREEGRERGREGGRERKGERGGRERKGEREEGSKRSCTCRLRVMTLERLHLSSATRWK